MREVLNLVERGRNDEALREAQRGARQGHAVGRGARPTATNCLRTSGSR
jgi:hypothetical protein